MTDEYAGHARQYRTFIGAVRLICDDLGIHFEDGKIYKPRPNGGSTYRFHAEGEHTLDFFLDTFVRANKIQKACVHISIRHGRGGEPFYDDDDIAERINERGYLERWATQALHRFNLKHHPVNLDALFDKTCIRVYGTYDDPNLAVKEMKLLVNGMRFAEPNKPAYRFRHVNGLMRTYSYCFYVGDGSAVRFWAFFHDMGGLDSGGHSKYLKDVEEMVAENLPTNLKCRDIERARLLKFLSEHVTAFNRVARNTLCFDLGRDRSNFGARFSKEYSKFLMRCDNGEYYQALRDLRALVQTAMEKVCEKKGVPLPGKPNIAKLCGRLVEHNVLDGEETTRYGAFSVAANKAAHRALPTEGDFLAQNTEDRVKTAILLGTQLIGELGGMVEGVDDADGDY